MNKFAIAHFNRLGSKAKAVALAATGAALTVARPAMAAAIDVAAVETDIKAQIASIVIIGSAVLLVYASVRAFRWVRAAMS